MMLQLLLEAESIKTRCAFDADESQEWMREGQIKRLPSSKH